MVRADGPLSETSLLVDTRIKKLRCYSEDWQAVKVVPVVTSDDALTTFPRVAVPVSQSTRPLLSGKSGTPLTTFIIMIHDFLGPNIPKSLLQKFSEERLWYMLCLRHRIFTTNESLV